MNSNKKDVTQELINVSDIEHWLNSAPQDKWIYRGKLKDFYDKLPIFIRSAALKLLTTLNQGSTVILLKNGTVYTKKMKVG